ncbi:MAG: hypothetical protein HQM12_21995 [SAR324 cluster bacterium]|nr:hypothetical protein [SAR324 cluster bacterium]
MKYYIPEWDDRVDPDFNFLTDQNSPTRIDPYEHDLYAHELYDSPNYDGILISKVVLEENKTKQEKARTKGVHAYVRIPKHYPVFGDCGAFGYLIQHDPPYETDEILKYYQELGFDYGVSIDHMIVPGILKRKRYFQEVGGNWVPIEEGQFKHLSELPNSKIVTKRNTRQMALHGTQEVLLLEEEFLDEMERERRYQLTIRNAEEFIKQHRDQKYSFTPIGAVQGWDPDSYAHVVQLYQEMGYRYIALGGLVRSQTSEILEILEAVSPIKKAETEMHLFGVARLEAIPQFQKMGVTSVDSAGPLRQAWLSSSKNYYDPHDPEKAYSAIRIPPSEGKKMKKSGGADTSIQMLEQKSLNLLRAYDRGEVSLQETLDAVLEYNHLAGEKQNYSREYYETLKDKPWKTCPCLLCKKTGIDIIIFRRNNRNRRRGFHNTWAFYRFFKNALIGGLNVD